MFASKDIFLTPPSGGYTIGKSVRLRSSASAYFNRTPASATNRQTWTWSAWVKRGKLGATQGLFARNDASVATYLIFTSSDTLEISSASGAVDLDLVTTQVFRDPSAWYHLVLAVDTTQATASNRIKMYVNGIQITSFSTATYPAQNYNTYVNTAATHYIGNGNPAGSLGWYSDQYLTEINFIDGQQLTPSSFGTTNALTGVWQPAKYTGTYGTNGFYLNFSSNGTSAALGTDFSGNSNTWTVNNVSVTAGATYDSMVDSPTVSAVSSNYCVMNPLAPSIQTATSIVTLTNGNLTAAGNASTDASGFSTISMASGKWYAEFTCSNVGASTSFSSVGIAYNFNNTARINGVLYSPNGQKRIDNTLSSYGATYTIGDVIGIAVDTTTNSITFYKNNTSQGAISYTPTTSNIFFAFYDVNQASPFAGSYNFGQQPFTYTPPTGFVALNTQNLPTPTISNGALYMAATTYNGNLVGQVITNGGNNTLGTTFKPDLVWVKSRSAATDHKLTDSVRGATLALVSDSTAAETTDVTGVVSFNSNGFTLGTSTTYNNTGATYIGWQWQAGAGTSSSNTNGSITSTVSVGATQGFSVVTATSPASAGTVGHGLGVTPNMIIFKDRTNGSNYWLVWHSSFASATQGYMVLNTTAAYSTSVNAWNNTAPTSTTFSTPVVGTGPLNSGDTFVAYCFAAVKGFSAFGSYTGNGSADGPFVYLGFRPRFVMWKRTDTTGDWVIQDTTRGPYNQTPNYLLANISVAEGAPPLLDINSNGFKIRINDVGTNASGGTYIYMCFAENPFKNALAR